jgi:hypothetical protein
VSVQDITPDSVLAAVNAGADDIFKLAEHFEVMHVSHTLRSTIAALVIDGRLVMRGYRDLGVSVPILAVA